MALNLDPQGPEPVRDTRKIRLADVAEERQVVRDGIQTLAHGALICPSCDIPLVLDAAVPAGEAVRCGFCEHEGRAREFVVADVYDTVSNEVYVVATLAPSAAG
jgi:hypothetical protein